MSVRGPGDGGPRPGGPLEGLFVPPRHCPGGSGRARRSRSCRGTAGDSAVRTGLEAASGWGGGGGGSIQSRSRIAGCGGRAGLLPAATGRVADGAGKMKTTGHVKTESTEAVVHLWA